MGLRQRSSLKSLGDDDREENLKDKTRTAKPRGRYPLAETSPLSVKILRKDPALSLLLEEPLKIPAGTSTNSQTHSESQSHRETVIKVEKAVNSLGQLESEVIAALFPVDGRDPATFEVIAEQLGMTTEEVKGIADNALRGLRGGRALSRISNAWN